MSDRLPPFYCPYCGEEDIEPFGAAAGEWQCNACLRAWRLKTLGTLGRGDEDRADFGEVGTKIVERAPISGKSAQGAGGAE